MTNVTLYKDELRKINNRITKILSDENNVNEETGEISEAVIDQLNALDLRKEEIIEVLALAFHDYRAMAESIKNDPVVLEAKRKLELAKQYEAGYNSLKNLLAKVVPEGDKIETENYKISWRKSSVVEVDELECNLEELYKKQPELVRAKFEIDKKIIKELSKANKPLPNGVTIEERNNLQLK